MGDQEETLIELPLVQLCGWLIDFLYTVSLIYLHLLQNENGLIIL